jgi:hypothetical protein
MMMNGPSPISLPLCGCEGAVAYMQQLAVQHVLPFPWGSVDEPEAIPAPMFTWRCIREYMQAKHGGNYYRELISFMSKYYGEDALTVLALLQA